MKTVAGIEQDREQATASVFGKSVRIEQKLEELEGKKPETIRTVIPFQIKSLNEDDRTIEFIGSTKAKDSYGDVIEQAGWELKRFLGNPVVPWGHNYSMPPVAKALEVGIKDGNLTFKAQFATKDEYEWADTIFKLYKGGYLRAFSVGFIPLEYDGDWMTGYTFTKCELLEVSCVTVPANPEALVLGFKDGTFSENERKAMMSQAHKLIKALTESDENSDNEDMELKEAVTELTTQVKTLTELLTAKAEEPAEIVNDQTEADAAEATEVTEDKSELEASDGTEVEGETEDKAEGEAEPEIKSLTADEVREAVRAGVKSEIDYKLGKID
ncbi:HK97 family phage prohead protease [Pseudarthrobacter siccitolerans]|uniref:HK97 family phage prohead protease n=1 Tax=Pseudarthrobacter siccitolerans TaxID=861266 RepID=A0ABU0PG48_9MICC|nr:HK97 family phage prohead protease [Pseudarthrobacter siccitolerans]MDQ0672945.1 HK97 family phage prohead protease [Pseudarthrobacter siccitolerans]